MTIVRRVLPESPIASLVEYEARHGGGRALEAARQVGPDAVVAEVEASGLRGRGGAGFPTGRKWRTVLEHASDAVPTTVVVNGAEGEPGTYKDRLLLQRNPYAVLEGALVAASVVGAREVLVGLKAEGGEEVGRVERAIAEMRAAGWSDGVAIEIVRGPNEYLYGEETALLEVAAGRPPLPRIAPPYRRGAVELAATEDSDPSSGQPGDVAMASTTGDAPPPALVDNVETLAHVPGIVARGAAWFREVGTAQSPGTVLATFTGAVGGPAVDEVALGTTLGRALEEVAGGVARDRRVAALLPGVSGAVLGPEALDVPLTYEDMAEVGTGLGSVGFRVLHEQDDVVAAVAGVSRFLAVESCGQCPPCKRDGLALAAVLDRLARGEGEERDVEELRDLAFTVADGALCGLAVQHEAVINGLLERFGDDVARHAARQAEPAEPLLVAEMLSLDGGGRIDERQATKQPDWTYGDIDSGQWPADVLGERRAGPGSTPG